MNVIPETLGTVITTVGSVCFVIPFTIYGGTIVHELGHAISAKSRGIDSIGIEIGSGPELWSSWIGNCQFRLNCIPDGSGETNYNPDQYDNSTLSDKLNIARDGPYAETFFTIFTSVVALGLMWNHPDCMALQMASLSHIVISSMNSIYRFVPLKTSDFEAVNMLRNELKSPQGQ